jgi:hypothetical protein
MNGLLPPVISFDKSADGPAGRTGAVVVDVLGAGAVVVVDPDFPLLSLEQADATTASTVHATSAADGKVLSKRCIRLVVRPAVGTMRRTVTMVPATGKPSRYPLDVARRVF